MSTRQGLSRLTARTGALLVLPALSLVVAVGVGTSDASSGESNTVKFADAVAPADPVSASPSVARPGSQTALAVLSTIRVEKERPGGYRRELFTHWVDADGDSCNTREEVLIAESIGNPQVDAFGCRVVAGDWVSPYDNRRHEDPADLDIDHVVALKEAWDSGAWSWASSKRRSFANDLSDPRPLIAVTAGVNRSKGDKDPSNWLPANGSYLCTYLSDWVAIKSRWGLSMDQSEFGRVRKLLTSRCAGTTVASWGTPRRAPGGQPQAGEGTQVTDDPADTTDTSTETTVVKGSTGFRPGQFCTPVGARGTYNGRSYVCSRSNAQGVPYKDSRARWRQG